MSKLMMPFGPLVHRSKRDAWLMAVLAGAAATQLYVATIVLIHEEPSSIWLAPLLIAFALWIFWIMVRTQYEIDEPFLIVRCSFFRYRIELDSIVEVSPTRNPLSSPALSLDRLRVNYESKNRRKSLMISPQDKAAFLRDLARHSPGLKVQGDRAVRE
jgi:hypothetical protein